MRDARTEDSTTALPGTAPELAKLWHGPESWVREQARLGDLPSAGLGHYLRFSTGEGSELWRNGASERLEGSIFAKAYVGSMSAPNTSVGVTGGQLRVRPRAQLPMQAPNGRSGLIHVTVSDAKPSVRVTSPAPEPPRSAAEALTNTTICKIYATESYSCFYLPIQNSRKIASSTSSLLTSPVIEPSASAAAATSTATISGGIFATALARAASNERSAAASA